MTPATKGPNGSRFGLLGCIDVYSMREPVKFSASWTPSFCTWDSHQDQTSNRCSERHVFFNLSEWFLVSCVLLTSIDYRVPYSFEHIGLFQ